MTALIAVIVAAEVVLEIQSLSAMAPVWGWLVGGCAVVVALLALLLIWREFSGWLAVRRVDRLRTLLTTANASPNHVAAAVLHWSAALPSSKAVHAFRVAASTEMESASLREHLDVLLAAIDSDVDRLIRHEAARTGVLVALSGIPMLDAILCVWRSLRLMRQVAGAYGARPGFFGTLRLLRMILVHAVAIDVTQHAAEAVSNRIGGVAAAGGQGLVAATLAARLGLWSQNVCRPMPIPRRTVVGFAASSAADEVALRVRQTVQRAARTVKATFQTPSQAN
ncbi:MAG: DUF697 domain-containing protein [Planctomycetes bacterium]|jgi:putative membrane protein|nr:DUF697 domain-containing protein [Planctomycetota bacterium]MCP4839311.1 DUF697 domain-containing protein [Planctomycetota bacterium]